MKPWQPRNRGAFTASPGSTLDSGAVAQGGTITRGVGATISSVLQAAIALAYRAMMARELLRRAAQILGAGWSKGANARDAAGRIVPLHSGSVKAWINPEAVAFSPYGAICKAASQNPGTRMMLSSKARPPLKRPGSIGAT